MTLFENNMDMVQPELFSKVKGMGFGDHMHRLQITDWMLDVADDSVTRGINRNYQVQLDSGDKSYVYLSCRMSAYRESYGIHVYIEYQYPYSKYKNLPDSVVSVTSDNEPISTQAIRTTLENNKYVGFPGAFIDELIGDIKKHLDEVREFWDDSFLEDEKFYTE